MVAFDDVHILAKVINGDMNAQEPFCLLLLQITIDFLLICNELLDGSWIPCVVETIIQLLTSVLLDVFAQHLILRIYPYVR